MEAEHLVDAEHLADAEHLEEGERSEDAYVFVFRVPLPPKLNEHTQIYRRLGDVLSEFVALSDFVADLRDVVCLEDITIEEDFTEDTEEERTSAVDCT